METIRNRRLAFEPRYAYLEDADRYLSARPDPLLSVTVIGTGVNGREHMRVARYEGRMRVHGVYDPHPASAEGARAMMADLDTQVQLYESLEAACSDPAVDALVISTPNYSHLEVLHTAIQSGKHILLEKPMATTIPDAYRILQMARDYPSVFQIGLQYRYKSIFSETIAEAISRATIGTIKNISIQEHRIPFLDKVSQWNKFSEFSGGTLVEKCCHYFDLFNLLAQSRPERVIATGDQSVNYKDFEYDGRRSDIIDNGFVIVEYANGIRAFFHLCMFAPMFYEEVVLCGSEGRLKAWERQDFTANKGLECGMEINLGELAPTRYITPHYPTHIEEAGHHGATFMEHVRFVDAIQGTQTDAATVADGFWSVVIGAAAEESIRRRAPVDIDDYLRELDVPL